MILNKAVSFLLLFESFFGVVVLLLFMFQKGWISVKYLQRMKSKNVIICTFDVKLMIKTTLKYLIGHCYKNSKVRFLGQIGWWLIKKCLFGLISFFIKMAFPFLMDCNHLSQNIDLLDCYLTCVTFERII